MRNPDNEREALAEAPRPPAVSDEPRDHLARLEALLREAARLASALGIPPEAFAGGAMRIYLDAHPTLRAELEEAHIQAQLDALRQAGRIPQA